MTTKTCQVSVEWTGSFIGRKYCATHDVKWDGGGNCPDKEVDL